MTINQVKDRLITTQWGSFIESVICFTDQAKSIYFNNKIDERNKRGYRKAIAISENIPSSLAIVNCIIVLEGLANSTIINKKLNSLNLMNTSIFEKLLSLDKSISTLKNAILELTVTRDVITHAHIWKKFRSYNTDYSFKKVSSYFPKQYKSSLLPKYKKHVDLHSRRTKVVGLSVIPTDVNFLDCIIAYTILHKILKLFKWDSYPRVYSNAPMLSTETKNSINVDDSFCKIEHWLKYFTGGLHIVDSKLYNNFLSKFSL